jgi:hypothetical protein
MVNSLKSMRMGLRVHNHYAPNTMSQPPMLIANMRLQVVLANFETHIFTMPSTFHGTSIGNHDLKIVDCVDIAMGFLSNASMNEIMTITTIN